MTTLNNHPWEIIFCGFSGTLKTYLSSRLAHRLGAVWLPTHALARITTAPGATLQLARAQRYERCAQALATLAGMGVRVVAEGGFNSVETKRSLFACYPACPKVLIECVATLETRYARLKNRANDEHDVEQASAASILANWQADSSAAEAEINPTPAELGCDAVIRVNTSDFSFVMTGELGEALREAIFAALEHAFQEFRATDKCHGRSALMENFNELAPRYEESTEWRTDPTLLAQLQLSLPDTPADVLDIGSGTGLAAAWYSAQGHRCVGLDLSPQMSVRAAPRVILTNFGSALDLPFFDQSFDLALMRQMLHYTEPELALQEAHRVLRANGKLILSGAIAPAPAVRPVWEEFKNVTQPLRLRVFSEENLQQLLQAAGFEIVENRHASLMRVERFAVLAQRAREPSSGWASFLSMMQKIFAQLAPEMEFTVGEEVFSYRQFWLTVVAQKEDQS